MKAYPNHSVVRIHTETLKKLQQISKELKVKPPKVIDLLVNQYIKDREEK
jgi:antitoxin component of RelBE/YafQ-DinJ toxin-antitoxin module